MPKGQFISFEGGEGAGKTTQIQRLREMLVARGHQVIVTREPGGSEGAEEIRDLLVKGDPGRWDAMTELLLLYAARRDHVEKIIRPALEQGQWVLCDRFADSTMAYQGFGHGLGMETVTRIHQASLGDFWPDLTIYMDLPPKQGLARANARMDDENRFESMDVSFHEKLREGYQEIAASASDRFVTVDASQDIETVWQSVQQAASDRLGLS